MNPKVRLHFWKSLLFREYAADRGVDTIGGTGEWATVQNFYSALHMVQAYLESKSAPPSIKSHSDRQRALNALPETDSRNLKAKQFNQAFLRLKSISEQVRYDPGYRVSVTNLEDTYKDLAQVYSYLGTKVAAL